MRLSYNKDQPSMKRKIRYSGFLLTFIFVQFSTFSFSQPDWPAIKSNATFNVPDPAYGEPYLQANHVPGWEDGLYMTRDGMQLFSTYLPVDVFSWLGDFVLDPVCFDFHPYYRPPLLDIDTITNVFGCEKYMQSDIVLASRDLPTDSFELWDSSNLQEAFSFDGGAQGVLGEDNTFDLFVFTKDGIGTSSTDIFFMQDVPRNPTSETAEPIFVTEGQEDNPHIERLDDTTLVLLFDRDRYMYYALSYDNGDSWEEEVLIPTVLNDQAPYDVQPHLWNDGADWWVYFCAEDEDGIRSIFKSRQTNVNDWGNWDEPELVIGPNFIIPELGYIYGIGEPTLSEWGDLSFVVVYGNHELPDSTDAYDCDPWFLPRIDSPLSSLKEEQALNSIIKVFPNPANDQLKIELDETVPTGIEIQMLNPLGQICSRKIYQGNVETLDVQYLPPGLYFVRVEGIDGAVRVIVE